MSEKELFLFGTDPLLCIFAISIPHPHHKQWRVSNPPLWQNLCLSSSTRPTQSYHSDLDNNSMRSGSRLLPRFAIHHLHRHDTPNCYGHSLRIVSLFWTFFATAAAFNMSASSSSSIPAPPLPFPGPDWFENALGFPEDPTSYDTTQQRLLEMMQNSSDPNRKFQWEESTKDNEHQQQPTTTIKTTEVTFGTFSTPSVQELRDECARLQQEVESSGDGDDVVVSEDTTTTTTTTTTSNNNNNNNIVSWKNIVASVLDLHADPANAGAVFQAASQFNCLEFPSPMTTPEHGVTGYAFDHTQGPACAMACGPGTVYRNYLVPMLNAASAVGDDDNENDVAVIGQRKDFQINTLQPILDRLTTLNGGETPKIKVRNGYANSSNTHLEAIRPIIQHDNDDDELVGLLQVGVQADTEVTYPERSGRLVTQVYCSAIPVSYTLASAEAWEPLATVVLKGAYEATLLTAVRQYYLQRKENQQKQQQCPSNNDDDDGKTSPPIKVFLTLVGGGVFGNDLAWIWKAMAHAHHSVVSYGAPLEIAIVHYSGLDPTAELFVEQINSS